MNKESRERFMLMVEKLKSYGLSPMKAIEGAQARFKEEMN